MVGTSWLSVTEYCSTQARKPSGSKRSMMTTVPPSSWTPALQISGAEWYRGAGVRYTEFSSMPSRWRSNMPMPETSASSMVSPVRGRRIPLGCPVVPDEYSITSPLGWRSNGSAGISATASSYDSKPSMAPSAISRCGQSGMRPRSLSAAGAMALVVTSAVEPLSFTR